MLNYVKENDKMYDRRELIFLPLVYQRNSATSTAPWRAKHVELGRCFFDTLKFVF